jgi:hypothetical protein
VGDYTAFEILYFVCRNLAAWILCLIAAPFRMIFEAIVAFGIVIRGWNGSEGLAWPWEHNWNPFLETSQFKEDWDL